MWGPPLTIQCSCTGTHESTLDDRSAFAIALIAASCPATLLFSDSMTEPRGSPTSGHPNAAQRAPGAMRARPSPLAARPRGHARSASSTEAAIMSHEFFNIALARSKRPPCTPVHAALSAQATSSSARPPIAAFEFKTRRDVATSSRSSYSSKAVAYRYPRAKDTALTPPPPRNAATAHWPGLSLTTRDRADWHNDSLLECIWPLARQSPAGRLAGMEVNIDDAKTMLAAEERMHSTDVPVSAGAPPPPIRAC